MNIDMKEVARRADGLRKDGYTWEALTGIINGQLNLELEFENGEFVNLHKENVRKSWRRHVKGEFKDGEKVEEKIEQYEQGNNKEITAKGRYVKGLDGLLERCNIDLSVWKVDRHVVNKWDQHSVTKGMVELFQVKAWLSKIVPTETKFPALSPIEVKFNTVVASKKHNASPYKRALIIPDSQCGFRRDIRTGTLDPFHDRSAMDIAIQIADDVKPDRIVLLGDCLDLPEFSDKFIKSPDFYWTTQPALIELAWWIGMLIKRSGCEEFDYIEGNHEHRLSKSMINHLVSAYDLRCVDALTSPPAMSIENLLGLSKMGVNYHKDYPRGEVWINKNLRCRHGNIARKGGGSTSKAILRDTYVSEIVGHSHRFEFSCKTVMTGDGVKTYTVFSPGTISRIDGAVPSNTANEDWQQALGIVTYDGDDFEITPISINGGRAIYNGVLYSGHSYVPELKKDTGWDF